MRALLDVGCGPGRYLSALADVSPAAHHVGVDLSFGMAAEAKASADALLVDALVADAQDLPFGNAVFDVVIAAHMLYHVPDAEAAVFELARVLVPDGHALVVLNANAHMSEIRQLHLDAMADLAGATYLLPARASERWTIETAQPILAGAFDVLHCARVTRELVIPDAEPVVDYANSMQSFYAPFLPAGVTWAALMERMRARVEATIASDGAWRCHSDVGCFVCRAR